MKKLTLLLLLLLEVVVAAAQPARSAKPVVHQTPIILPPPDPKDWFVVRWESKVTAEEYSKGDYSGIEATLRHQGNVYKVKCTSLSIQYREDTNVQIPDNLKKGPHPCTVLSSYVGKSIPSDTLARTYDGWIISLPSDTDTGDLTFDKYILVGGVPVGGLVKGYYETYSVVSVEAIEDRKEAK